MLRDWSDNGRIDRVHPLPCYEEAIDGLPTDLRDYTDAEDVITRALTTALRASEETEPAPVTQLAAATVNPGSSAPLPLLVLVGLSLVVLATGGLAYVSRRRHAARDDQKLH